MTAIDPILLLKEILQAAGHASVHYDWLDGAQALASDEYIFLEQVGGVTPHTDELYRVTIKIVVYAKENPADNRESWKRHSKIQSDLKAAWGKKFTHGGIHRMINRLSPQREDILNIPYGVGRTASQFDFVLRTSEGWA